MLGRGNGQCKGPELGMCLACARDSETPAGEGKQEELKLER